MIQSFLTSIQSRRATKDSSSWQYREQQFFLLQSLLLKETESRSVSLQRQVRLDLMAGSVESIMRTTSDKSNDFNHLQFYRVWTIKGSSQHQQQHSRQLAHLPWSDFRIDDWQHCVFAFALAVSEANTYLAFRAYVSKRDDLRADHGNYPRSVVTSLLRDDFPSEKIKKLYGPNPSTISYWLTRFATMDLIGNQRILRECADSAVSSRVIGLDTQA